MFLVIITPKVDPLTAHPFWPWAICVVTAIVFGAIGHRNRDAGAIWAVGGAVLGLCVASIASGLANAVAAPSEALRHSHEFIALVVAIAIVVVCSIILALISRQKFRT